MKGTWGALLRSWQEANAEVKKLRMADERPGLCREARGMLAIATYTPRGPYAGVDMELVEWDAC